MTSHEDDLRRSRSELLAMIEAQREQMSGIASELQVPLALADQGVSVFRFMRRHPLLIAGAVVLFVIRRRRGVAELAGGLLGVWKGYQYVNSVWEKLLPRKQLPHDDLETTMNLERLES